MSEVKLKDICIRCENYNGEKHDYCECESCPSLKLYNNYCELKNKYDDVKSELSWTVNPGDIGRW